VTIVQPPYRAEVTAGVTPKFGAVAVARLGAAAEVLGPLHAVIEAAPWCAPFVVVTPGSVSPATLQAIWGLPGQPGFLVATHGFSDPAPQEIAAVIAARPRPTTSALVSYVVRRTHSVLLGQTLQQIWEPRGDPGPGNAERTLRYRLRRLGRFGRHDWIRVLRLIQTKTSGPVRSVERLAAIAGTEPRTLRTWTTRCLGVPLNVFRERVGWEWVLEAALRTAGLVMVPALPALAERGDRDGDRAAIAG
jgi:hypothetical protein